MQQPGRGDSGVLGLYRAQVKRMLRGLLGQDRVGLALAGNIVVAFLSATVAKLLFEELIEEYLFGLWAYHRRLVYRRPGHPSRFPSAAAGGAGLEMLNWRTALLIGTAQCLALWPGTSRRLVTILAGSLTGLSLSGAVKFSFLLGVLTLTAATGYKAMQGGWLMVQAYGWHIMLTGFSLPRLRPPWP